MRSMMCRVALSAAMVVVAGGGCALDGDGASKNAFDATEVDQALAADPKADYYTNRTTIFGMLLPNTYAEAYFVPGGYTGFTFEGHAGDVISLALDATDGTSDPVLMLYGPRRPTGIWPTRIALNDDSVGTDSRLWDVTLPGDGLYLAVAAEYYRTGGTYEMTLWQDTSAPPPPPPPVCEDVATVTASSSRYNRLEAPRFANACAVDTDCVRTGCSREVCAAESVPTTCEVVELPTGTCGCVAGSCVWNVEVCE